MPTLHPEPRPTYPPDQTATDRVRLAQLRLRWIVRLGPPILAVILVGIIGKWWSATELERVEREIIAYCQSPEFTREGLETLFRRTRG